MMQAQPVSRIVAALVLCFAFAAARPAIAADCALGARCHVEGGYYIAKAPEGWDGASPLPVALFFHGWQGTAEGVLQNGALTGQFSSLGTLLVVPAGQNKSWAFPGAPSQHRDELVFVGRVLDDVLARYPVDRSRVWATGFSLGGSMVWTLACFMGERFTAFVPVAGAFWDPIPEDCPSGPQSIRHIHGLTDKTVPLEGRAIRSVFRQSDVFDSFDTWKKVNGCSPQPDRFTSEGQLLCRIWDSCTSGAVLQMCLHDGGHSVRSEWIEGGKSFVDSVAASSGRPATDRRAGQGCLTSATQQC